MDGFKIKNGNLSAYTGNEVYVIIPDYVTTIDNYTFECCSNMQCVRIPDSVQEIGYKAFAKCRNLHTVMMGKNIGRIKSEAFANCAQLTDINLPESCLFGDAVFSGTAWLNQQQDDFVIHSHHLFAYHGKKGTSNFRLFLPSNQQYERKPPENPIFATIPDEVFEMDNSVRNTLENIDFLTYHKICFTPYMGNTFSDLNLILMLIREKDFSIKIDPILKYDILSRMKLLYPDDPAICNYLQINVLDVFRFLTEQNCIEIIQRLLKNPDILNPDTIDPVIRYAIDHKKYEIQVLLIEYKNKYIGYEDTAAMIRKKLSL